MTLTPAEVKVVTSHTRKETASMQAGCTLVGSHNWLQSTGSLKEWLPKNTWSHLLKQADTKCDQQSDWWLGNDPNMSACLCWQHRKQPHMDLNTQSHRDIRYMEIIKPHAQFDSQKDSEQHKIVYPLHYLWISHLTTANKKQIKNASYFHTNTINLLGPLLFNEQVP